MFEPISNEKIYKVVMRQLTDLIKEGNLAPGDRLPPERELAERLTVSRVSVRQAIAALDAQGIVTNRHGDGTYIAERQNVDEVIQHFSRFLAEKQIVPDEILECRLIVECEAARMCAERATSDQIVRLENLLERNREVHGEAASLSQMNRDLHRAIAQFSDNRVLRKVMELLLEMMDHNMWPQLKRMSEERERRIQNHLDQHEEIVRAIAEHNGPSAYEAMRVHLETIREEMSHDLAVYGAESVS